MLPSSPEDQDTSPLPRIERVGTQTPPKVPVFMQQPSPGAPSPLAGRAPTTGQLSGKVPTTGLLPSTTRRLPEVEPTTSKTRQLTHIPAPKKRQRKVSPATPPSRRRHTARTLTVLICSIAILIIATFFATPLGQSQQNGFTQVISSIFSSSATNDFSTAQQIATPSPTPAKLTNEGYCGGSDIWGTCATAITDSGLMGTGTMTRPLNGATITQVFANPEYQWWCSCVKPHSGIDLAAPAGTPIMAADSGQVIWVGWDTSGLGWAVKINHGHYIATIYGHLERFIVKVGQNVTKGDVIAYEGSTGQSTGPHLHFMVLVNNFWVNPALYVQLP